jgi:hypothetical protein
VKFTCNVGDFWEAYSLASHTIDKVKNATNTTRMLLIQALKTPQSRVLIFSNDGIACSLKRVAADVEEEGVALIDPKEMGKTLPNLDQTAKLSFQLKDGKLTFSCGKFKPKCATADPTLPAAQLKDLPLRAKANLEIPAWALREVMDRTVLFASKQTAEGTTITQPFLQNVYLRTIDCHLEAYASNNSVLAKARVKLPDGTPDLQVDIPARAIPALQKILSNPQFRVHGDSKVPTIKLHVERDATGPKRLSVKTNEVFYNTTLSANRIPAKAVDSETQITNAVSATVQLSRADFLAVVRRCEPFVEIIGEAQALHLSLENNCVTIFDRDGEELDQIQGTGESSNTNGSGKLDLDFVKGVLGASKEDAITLRFIRSANAILFSSGEETEGRSFYVVGCLRSQAAKKTAASVPAPADATAAAQTAA